MVLPRHGDDRGPMTTTPLRRRTAALAAGATLSAVLLGTSGVADAAAGLTADQVQKIAKKTAAKVVRKAAPKLDVGDSAKLDGKAPGTYLETGSVFTATISTPVSNFEYHVPVGPGSYLVAYSAYLTGAGDGNCYLTQYQGATPFMTTADSYARRGLSGSAIVTLAAGQSLRLYCSGDSPFTTYDSAGVTDPIRVSVVPLDSVNTGALSVAPRAGAGRPGR